MTNFVTPKVSICMPVYNGGDYIAETIESVLEQTYKDFHLIVCDNCSTDNTEEIVRRFNDIRIKYIRNTKNIGPIGNTNRCIELANGEYVYIFHHDDLMMPENLELKVRLLDENPNVGFVHSNLIVIDTAGEIISPSIWNKDSRCDYIEDGLAMFRKYLTALPFAASMFIGTILARRSCYKDIGGFNYELPHCYDSEMWMRMLLSTNVACIGTPLVKYRVHDISASSKWGDYMSLPYLTEHYQAMTIILNKYKTRIPQAYNLKQRISFSFGKRSIGLACSALSNGDFLNGKKYFKEAVRMSPWIIGSLNFWRVVLGLTIGQSGVRRYQTIKKHFKR